MGKDGFMGNSESLAVAGVAAPQRTNGAAAAKAAAPFRSHADSGIAYFATFAVAFLTEAAAFLVVALTAFSALATTAGLPVSCA